jgi:hypothetical protein
MTIKITPNAAKGISIREFTINVRVASAQTRIATIATAVASPKMVKVKWRDERFALPFDK